MSTAAELLGIIVEHAQQDNYLSGPEDRVRLLLWLDEAVELLTGLARFCDEEMVFGGHVDDARTFLAQLGRDTTTKGE